MTLSRLFSLFHISRTLHGSCAKYFGHKGSRNAAGSFSTCSFTLRQPCEIQVRKATTRQSHGCRTTGTRQPCETEVLFFVRRCVNTVWIGRHLHGGRTVAVRLVLWTSNILKINYFLSWFTFLWIKLSATESDIRAVDYLQVLLNENYINGTNNDLYQF